MSWRPLPPIVTAKEREEMVRRGEYPCRCGKPATVIVRGVPCCSANEADCEFDREFQKVIGELTRKTTPLLRYHMARFNKMEAL